MTISRNEYVDAITQALVDKQVPLFSTDHIGALADALVEEDLRSSGYYSVKRQARGVLPSSTYGEWLGASAISAIVNWRLRRKDNPPQPPQEAISEPVSGPVDPEPTPVPFDREAAVRVIRAYTEVRSNEPTFSDNLNGVVRNYNQREVNALLVLSGLLDPDPVTLDPGSVIQGSTVRLIPLDDQGNPTGETVPLAGGRIRLSLSGNMLDDPTAEHMPEYPLGTVVRLRGSTQATWVRTSMGVDDAWTWTHRPVSSPETVESPGAISISYSPSSWEIITDSEQVATAHAAVGFNQPEPWTEFQPQYPIGTKFFSNFRSEPVLGDYWVRVNDGPRCWQYISSENVIKPYSLHAASDETIRQGFTVVLPDESLPAGNGKDASAEGAERPAPVTTPNRIRDRVSALEAWARTQGFDG